MTKRSQWCEFDKETRKIIKERDKGRCIFCGSKGPLQIAHIFLSRAFGGRGCKENGVFLCITCHQILDNPIGGKQRLQKEVIENHCRRYLIEKENIILNDDFIDNLKFDKKAYLEQSNSKKLIFDAKTVNKALKETELEEKNAKEYKYIQKCKSCSMIAKNKNNSSIPTYYCKYKKRIVSKQDNACERFKKRGL